MNENELEIDGDKITFIARKIVKMILDAYIDNPIKSEQAIEIHNILHNVNVNILLNIYPQYTPQSLYKQSAIGIKNATLHVIKCYQDDLRKKH